MIWFTWYYWWFSRKIYLISSGKGGNGNASGFLLSIKIQFYPGDLWLTVNLGFQHKLFLQLDSVNQLNLITLLLYSRLL